MIYFYPKLSTTDLLILRSPGAGLGNLLFTWARAARYAQHYNGTLLRPTWRNVKLGPILRRENDLRIYGDLFKHRTPSMLLTTLKLRSMAQHIGEDEFLDARRQPSEDLVVVVEGTRNHFRDIASDQCLIRAMLASEAKGWEERHDKPFIAVHIRTGDFGAPSADGYKRNSRLPLPWYKEELERVRGKLGALPCLIFTDDTSNAVSEIFREVNDIAIANPKSAVIDILNMSRASHIICSNSTFSLWAAFLSTGTVSTKYDELFFDYDLASEPFQRRIA